MVSDALFHKGYKTEIDTMSYLPRPTTEVNSLIALSGKYISDYL